MKRKSEGKRKKRESRLKKSKGLRLSYSVIDRSWLIERLRRGRRLRIRSSEHNRLIRL